MNSSTQLLISSAPNLVDIAVLGAGPAGMAMSALAVADDPNRKILLIDNSTLAEKTKENRVLALSYGSKQILAQADLWDESIVRCAIERKESRGLHYTLDYPELSNELRKTVLTPPNFEVETPLVNS